MNIDRLKTIITIAFTSAITSWLFIPAASANTPSGHGQGRHQKAQRLLDMFDKNNDRVLDASELQAMLEARAQRKAKRRQHALQRFDTNQDGTLDENERAAMRAQKQQRRAAVLQRFDQNGNGTLDPPERRAMAQQRFDRLLQRFDTNQDGALAWSEITAHAGQGQRKRGHGKGAGKAEKLRKLFRAADSNNDDMATRAEFQQALKKLGDKVRGPMSHGPGHAPWRGHGPGQR